MGRPKNKDQQQASLRMCENLERNDEEQLTISDVVSKMKGYLLEDGSVPYGNQYLKETLKWHYGYLIYEAEGGGLNNFVTMREKKTSKILRDSFKSTQGGDEERQKRAIIKPTAKLMKSDIKTNVPPVTEQYPPSQSVPALDYLPMSLRSILNFMLVGVDKYEEVSFIGHSIVEAEPPHAVVAPLQIGLVSQLQSMYKSRFTVDTLSTMGFCSSYAEVQKCQKNSSDVVTSDVLGGPLPDMLVFAADKVDYNILTIDGKGTFHGMGMLAETTPRIQRSHVVRRKNVSLQKWRKLTQLIIAFQTMLIAISCLKP